MENKKEKTPLSFRATLLLFMIGGSSLLLLMMGIILNYFSGKYIQQEYKQTHDTYMELLSSTLEEDLEDIVDEARAFLENDRFLQILKEGEADSAYFNSSQQLYLDTELYGLIDDNAYIRGVLAISSKGNFRYLQRASGTLEGLSRFYQSGRILEESWIREAEDAKGRESVYGWNLLDEEDDSAITITKAMNSPKTQELVGYLAITISKSIIRKLLSMHSDFLEDNRFLVIDTALTQEDPHYVVYNRNIPEEDMADILSAYQDPTQTRYLFGSYNPSKTGWELVSVIERRDLSRQSKYVTVVIIICLCIMLLILIPAANALTNRINRPLRQMEEAIFQVGGGNYHPDICFDNSEIGKVGRYLLKTSENNLQLREELLQAEVKEREAQMHLLQSQINPHFLYNTLDALYFMAIIDQADDVADMVKALSDMFRLNLNRGSKLIRICEEMQKIEAYMKIQNMRYQNRFTLEIDIDREILNERILTFLIQPIVENAVTHGLENKIGEGTVSIIGYRDGGEMRILVHDDGAGISDMSRLETGYGVQNVRERVRLFYGAEYDVTFESTPGEGTTAFFRFPFLSPEKTEAIESEEKTC